MVVSKPAKIETDLVNGSRETEFTATALFEKSSFEIIARKGMTCRSLAVADSALSRAAKSVLLLRSV